MHASPSIWNRLVLLIPTSVLAYLFLIFPAMQAWKTYWLLKDGQQGMAEIIGFAAKNGVVYRYRVHQKEYTGKDRRTWDDRVKQGARQGPIVYFFSSHPWLSQLHQPTTLMPPGLPVLIVAWIMLGLLLVTVVGPNSKWALRLGRKEAESAADPRK